MLIAVYERLTCAYVSTAIFFLPPRTTLLLGRTP